MYILEYIYFPCKKDTMKKGELLRVFFRKFSVMKGF
jgi:hypothetical protein